MKHVLALMFVMLSACGIAQAGTFGLTRGMTKEQVIALIGKDAVLKSETMAGIGTSLRVSRVPQMPKDFEEYRLIFSDKEGLLKIIALSNDVDTSEDGANLRERYDLIKSQMRIGYGAPTQEFDFVKAGSLWTEPRDFMMGLVKDDRTLNCYWIDGKEGMKLPGGLQDIVVEANASTSSKGWVAVTYEFHGWDAFLDAVHAKEAQVF